MGQGAGGGGGFLLAAPAGVWFSGHVRVGTGGGAVYGRLLNPAAFAGGAVGVHSYARWDAMPEFALTAGAGGGGTGGGGQTLPTPPDAAVVVAHMSTPDASRAAESTTPGPIPPAAVRVGLDGAERGGSVIGPRASPNSTPAVPNLHDGVFADAMTLAAVFETLS
jgi:hypothetical protein